MHCTTVSGLQNSAYEYVKANMCICICYTIAARGLLVVHEWPVLIGHEGVARVVYQN